MACILATFKESFDKFKISFWTVVFAIIQSVDFQSPAIGIRFLIKLGNNVANSQHNPAPMEPPIAVCNFEILSFSRAFLMILAISAVLKSL